MAAISKQDTQHPTEHRAVCQGPACVQTVDGFKPELSLSDVTLGIVPSLSDSYSSRHEKKKGGGGAGEEGRRKEGGVG